MLLTTVESYILLEFRSQDVVRFKTKTRHLSLVRGVGHRDKTGFTFSIYRAYPGTEILYSELSKIMFEKRKLTRTTVFAALISLTDAGSLVFFTNRHMLPLERTFVLTKKGANVINNCLLFKKAANQQD